MGVGGPLVLRIGETEIVLPRRDVDSIDEFIDAFVASVRDAATRANSTEGMVAAQKAIDGAERLRAELAGPGGPLAPPLAVVDEQGRILRRVLADAAGYHRRELTPALHELREALATV